jgi:hypothetical protein
MDAAKGVRWVLGKETQMAIRLVVLMEFHLGYPRAVPTVLGWASLTERWKEVLIDFQLAAQMDDATDSDLAASTADLMVLRWEAVMDSC